MCIIWSRSAHSSMKMPRWNGWTGNLGSKVTMKYPSVYLLGRGAKGDILSIAFAADGQHQDAGGKAIHGAPDTTSTIISKSISKESGAHKLPRTCSCAQRNDWVQILCGVRCALYLMNTPGQIRIPQWIFVNPHRLFLMRLLSEKSVKSSCFT